MSRIATGLAGAALAGALFAASSPEFRAAAGLQDRIQALEDDQSRLERRNKALERSAAELEERVEVLEKRTARELPEDARVVPLEGGGTERWELPSGAAYVQFLRLDERGVPVFTIRNGGGSAEIALRAGEAHVAVDDRGSERRVHTTTLHRIIKNRNGAPATGLVTVRFEARGAE